MNAGAAAAVCMACRSALKIVPDEYGQLKQGWCSNAACPGQRDFYFCGYCKQISFATSHGLRHCVNRECAAYERRRTNCDQCGMPSVMEVRGGRKRCLQPNCPTAKGHVTHCVRCRQARFFTFPDTQFCVKGGGQCPDVFRRKEPCFACELYSYDLERLRCENPACAYRGRRLVLCAACGVTSFDEQQGRCESPACGVQLIPCPVCSERGFDAPRGRCFKCGLELSACPSCRLISFDAKKVRCLRPTCPGPQASAQQTLGGIPSSPSAAADDASTLIGIIDDGPKLPPGFADMTLAGQPLVRPTTPSARESVHLSRPKPPAPPKDPEPPKQPEPSGAQPFFPNSVTSLKPQPTPEPARPSAAKRETISARMRRLQLPPPPSAPKPASSEMPLPPSTPTRAAPKPTPPPPEPAPTVPAGPAPLPPTPAAVTPPPPKPEPLPEPRPEPAGPAAEDLLAELELELGFDEPNAPTQAPTPAAPAPAPKPAAPAPAPEPTVAFEPEPTPEPAPPPAPPRPTPAALGAAPAPPTLPRSPAPAGRPDLAQVFTFLDETFCQNAPLVLLVGLPGVGKSSYLTMLGEAFAHSERYHLPPSDIEAEPLPRDALAAQFAKWRNGGAEDAAEFREHVRDLVFDFASQNFRHYMSRGLWMRTTLRRDTSLLVTELRRNARPLARLITIDAPGETYQRIFRQALELEGLREQAPDPETLTVARMLHKTEALLLLIPANNRDDGIYANFLRVACRALHPRAMAALRQAADAALAEPNGVPILQARVVIRRACTAFLGTLARGTQALNSSGDTTRALLELRQLFEQVRPDAAARFQREAVFQGDKVRAEVEIMRRVAQACLESSELLDELARRTVVPSQGTPSRDSVVQAILEDRDARDEVVPDLDAAGDATDTPFARLRSVHLIVTKADMFPIPADPAELPRRLLPSCQRQVRRLQSYLRLVGGDLKFFRSSATGHTFVQGARAFPGLGEVIPINVVEPVLELLGVDGTEPGA